jgi:OmpA-OmpF porin, OOP family
MNPTTSRRLAGCALCAALTSFAIGVPGAAHAQAYVGGSIGSAHWSDTPCGTGGDCKGNETGGTFRAGWALSPYFAVEARYIDLGKISSRSIGATVTVPDMQVQVIRDESSAKGGGINVVGTWPMADRIFVSGMVGVAILEARQRSESHFEPVGALTDLSLPFDATRHTTKGYYGVSVGYSITPALAMTLEAERYHPVFNETVPIDLFAVGLTYRFH